MQKSEKEKKAYCGADSLSDVVVGESSAENENEVGRGDFFLSLDYDDYDILFLYSSDGLTDATCYVLYQYYIIKAAILNFSFSLNEGPGRRSRSGKKKKKVHTRAQALMPHATL